MARYAQFPWFLAISMALTLPGMAQENSLNGSWKMDKSTLKYDGPTLSITINADGYTLTRGDKVAHKVVCNGKPNAPDEGTVTTCNKTSTGYALENTRDGKVSSKVKVDVSPDGKTLTRTATITPSKESPFNVTVVMKRVSGDAGSTAVWKEVSFDESQETGLLTIKITGDSVEIKETDAPKAITCKLDGTPVTISGGRTLAAKMAGKHTVKLTYMDDGKVWRVNTFALSPDGQTVKETDATPAPSLSSMTVLFHKA